MRSRMQILPTAIAALGLCFLLGCSRSEQERTSDTRTTESATVTRTHMDSTMGSMAMSPPRDDAEVLATIMAIDSTEVAAATIAQYKKLSGPVQEYAEMMRNEHSANLKQAGELSRNIPAASPGSSPMLDQMRSTTASDLAQLQPLDGAQFEREYLKQMVQGHTLALQHIDQMLPGVRSQQLRDFLTETRRHVAMHFDRAKELQRTAAQ